MNALVSDYALFLLFVVCVLFALCCFACLLKFGKIPEDGLPVTSGVLVRVALHLAALLEDFATWG